MLLAKLPRKIQIGEIEITSSTQGQIVKIQFKEAFESIPIIVCSPKYSGGGSQFPVVFTLSNVTLVGFEIVIAQTPPSHSPVAEWIAIGK